MNGAGLTRLSIAVVLVARAALADPVTDWNVIMRGTISAEPPQAQTRFAAITHLAVFEAVNAIVGQYEPYLRNITADKNASKEAAVIATAHGVLRNYFPNSASNIDGQRTASLAVLPDGPSKVAGIAAGEAAAAAMIAHRANDGSATPVPYTPQTGPGFWQPTPPAFAAATFLHWGRLKPFGIARADQFRPEPPPALTSSAYARDYNEVKAAGDALADSNGRPQDRVDVVRYIAMVSPVNVWNPVAVQLSSAASFSLEDNAHLFALLNMAIADAASAVFEAKYVYQLWRPVTAIRGGDFDSNPRTQTDAAFTPFIATPPYPAYPSGAGGLGNAGRALLEEVFGRGRHAITLSTPLLPNLTLRYTKLRHITDDTADARIYAGIHFRFDQEASELLGERVARYVLRNNLRCASNTCSDALDGGR